MIKSEFSIERIKSDKYANASAPSGAVLKSNFLPLIGKNLDKTRIIMEEETASERLSNCGKKNRKENVDYEIY